MVKINGWCQKILASLCECWCIEVLGYTGSTVHIYIRMLCNDAIHVHTWIPVMCTYAHNKRDKMCVYANVCGALSMVSLVV